MATSEGFNEEDEADFIRLCGKLGGRMTAAVYNALAAKTALTAIETVMLRQNGDRTEVLLMRRSPEDVHYPNQWHSPGTMLRSSDAHIQCDIPGHFLPAFARVEKEFGGTFIGDPRFVGYMFQRTPRGVENALIFVCTVSEVNTKGQWFDVDNLPHPLIGHHYPIIRRAYEQYLEMLSPR